MRDQMPKVSVVIPTYNRAHLISRAIHSVLNQTYQDLEIVIIDDGSIDNTEEIVKSFEDERIVYLRHSKNKGASAARNTGIKASKGDYIAFQDSDDEWFPDKLERQVNTFDNAPSEIGIVYSGFYRIEADKKTYIPGDYIVQKDGNIHNELLKGNFVGTPAVLIKKECFKNNRYFNETLPALEDWEMWVELSKHYQFKYIDEPLLYSYSMPNSVNLNKKNLLKAREMILAIHLNDFNKNKKLLSDHYLSIGIELISNDNFANGKDYFIKAVKTNYLNTSAILRLLVLLFGRRTYLRLKYIHQKVPHKT